VLAPALAVLATDDSRLVRVKREADLADPRSDRGKHSFGLPLAHTMHDTIVGIALERAAREIPDHPRVKRDVHEQVRQDRRDRRSLRSSLVSLF
jgi:hypothetical protein